MSAKTDSVHVLHVDDEPDFADLAAEFLEREDDRISVQTTTNARKALDVLADSDIDCIVSDHDMPGQNGIEFLETVREKRPDLPFILYTGKGSEAVASDAISAGVTDYLQKESGTEQYKILANEIVSAVQKYRTERELDDLRRRYTELVEQNFVGIYIIQHGEFVYVNPRLAEIHGYDDPEELIGLSPLDLVASEERDRVQSHLERRLSGEMKEIQYQTVGLGKDGERIDIELHGSRIKYAGDSAIIGAELDITERKERERALREEKEKYSTLVEQSHDGILVLQDGEIKFVNEQAVEIFGYEESELLGKSHVEIVAPQDRERLEGRYLRRLDPETESPPAQYDMQFLTKDREQRHANISAAKIQFDGEPADLVSFRDISERKRYEAELQRARTRFQTLFEKAPEAIAIHDRNGRYLEVNNLFQEELGYSRDTLTSMNIADVESGLSPEEVHDEMAEMHVGETQKIKGVHERKDGSTFPVEIWANKVEIDGDVRFLAFGRDITERKKRERELQDLYQTYRDLFDGINDAVFVHEPEGTFLEVNEEAIDRLGYDEDELLELTPEDIDAPDHAPHAADRIETIEEEGTHTFESVHMTKSGDLIPVHVSSSIIDYFGDSAVLSVARDITERKEHEQELEQANDQLRVLNQILRHDIRNDMNIVLGWGEELEEHVDEEGEQMLNRIQDSSRHVIDLTKTLRDFMKVYRYEEAPELTSVDIGNSIANEIRKIQEQYQSVVVEVPDEVPHIKVRANELITTIFWNLLQNVIKHNDKEVPKIEIGVEENEKTVTIQVADNGPGIPEEQRDEIFEKGESGLMDPDAGIGLYLVDTVVTQYGGDVWVEENEPEGAMFVVELPKTEFEG